MTPYPARKRLAPALLAIPAVMVLAGCATDGTPADGTTSAPVAAPAAAPGASASVVVDTAMPELRPITRPVTVLPPATDISVECRFDMVLDMGPNARTNTDVEGGSIIIDYTRTDDGMVMTMNTMGLVRHVPIAANGGLDGAPVNEDMTPVEGPQLPLTLAALAFGSPDGILDRPLSSDTVLDGTRYNNLVGILMDQFWTPAGMAQFLERAGQPRSTRAVKGLITLDGREAVVIETEFARQDVARDNNGAGTLTGYTITRDAYDLTTGVPLMQIESGYLDMTNVEGKRRLLRHATDARCLPVMIDGKAV